MKSLDEQVAYWQSRAENSWAREDKAANDIVALVIDNHDLKVENERLRGVIERLEIEKHDLVERLEVATTLLRLEGGTR